MNNYKIRIEDIGGLDHFRYTSKKGNQYLIISNKLSKNKILEIKNKYEACL